MIAQYQLALTAGLALATALTLSCSGDGGGEPPPGGSPNAEISSSGDGGSSSSVSSGDVSSSSESSSSGVSSSSIACAEWEWKVTTPATCETSQTTGIAKETETCKANPSITRGEPREIGQGRSLEWEEWKLVGGVGKRCCKDDPNNICETSNELLACGTRLYAPAYQFCQAGTNYVQLLCGGTETFTSTEFCQNGTVTPKCGGTKEYMSTQFCQAGTNYVWFLCGGTETFTSAEFCQNGTVINKCGYMEYGVEQSCQGNVVMTKCGSEWFNLKTQFCHNNNKVVNFCGTRTETFDPDLYECRTGSKIYLKGGITDSRGGTSKTYEAVLIGTKTWMAENLNYNADGSKCYGDKTGGDSQNHCGTYGRLYDWATAMANSPASSANPSGVQGVCPAGWHLPSEGEWKALDLFIKRDQRCSDCATEHLKSPTLWNEGTGLDTYGFAALPGGYGISGYLGNFYFAGDSGSWWSASEKANSADLFIIDAYYVSLSYDDKTTLNSVRCAKD